MKKILILIVSIVLIGMFTTGIQAQSLTFKIGIFNPTANSDLWESNLDNLAFEKKDMQGQYYGLEYEQFMNPNFTVFIEGGHYTKEHYSFYRDYEYDDGSPIYQNLALQISSLELGFKFYPMSNRTRIAPFFGAAAGVYYWQYEQWGDFIDVVEGTVSEAEYVEASEYSFGFSGKAGILFRPTRNLGFSVEARYQFLKGDLEPFFEGFEKFDMNGFTLTAGFSIYFR
jgi:hypothetical protein